MLSQHECVLDLSQGCDLDPERRTQEELARVPERRHSQRRAGERHAFLITPHKPNETIAELFRYLASLAFEHGYSTHMPTVTRNPLATGPIVEMMILNQVADLNEQTSF